MSEFTPRMKEAAEGYLKKMNEKLRDAVSHYDNGENAKAIDDLEEAITFKHEAISCFPSVTDTKGVPVPFFGIYDVFFDVYHLTYLAGQCISVLKADQPPTKESIEQLAAEINNVITEIRRALLRKFSLPAGAEQILRDMIEALEDLRDMLKRCANGETVSWDDFERIQRMLKSYKKMFWEGFAAPLSLWDAYSLFEYIDEDILSGLGWISHGYPPGSRAGRISKGHIQSAKAAKEKLEALLRGAKPQPPVEPPPPPLPEGPLQPKPEYPQGGEDLPPFPPEGYAMRRGGIGSTTQRSPKKRGGRRK